MVNVSVKRSRTALKQRVTQSLLVGVICVAGVISGWVPSLSMKATPTFVFGTSAYAQSNNEVQAFARIALEYEAKRRDLIGRIATIIGSKNVPDIACNSNNQPRISGSLPSNAMPLAQQLCNEYISTIQKHGMSRERFEEILRNMSTNLELKRRIDQALINLQ